MDLYLRSDSTDTDKNSIPPSAQSDPEWYTAPAAGHNSGGGCNTGRTPHHTADPAGGWAAAAGAGSLHSAGCPIHRILRTILLPRQGW